MPSPDISVIVPTFNEAENVPILIDRLQSTLKGIHWEVIYVDDDSPDGTAARVAEFATSDPRIRLLHRIGRRGLSSAVVEGVMSSCAPFFAVIDADLQHDERILPEMLRALKQDEKLDVVIGSRYTAGGGVGTWAKERVSYSKFAGKVSRLVLKSDLTDPMSGFFAMRKASFNELARDLSGKGFKILLDIFASASSPLRFLDVPYTFRTREHGESKLDTAVLWEFLMLILDKLFGRVIPARFIVFGFVGLLGLGLYLALLGIAYKVLGVDFSIAVLVCTVATIAFNFSVNNLFTYRDKRLKGNRIIWGFLSFLAISSVGIAGNISLAEYILEQNNIWWVAGFAGALVGVVWNYTISSVFTWGRG